MCQPAVEPAGTAGATTPSEIRSTRSAAASTSWSWVATSTLTPSASATARSSFMICRALTESSWAVGSSAISTGGRLARARAIATRCCWPPDSSCARCAAWSPRPTIRSSSMARSSLAAGSVPTRRIGTATFSAAVRIGISA